MTLDLLTPPDLPETVPTTPRGRGPRRLAVAAVALAALAYSWLATHPRLFAYAPDVAVGVPVLLAAAAAIRSWRRHDRARAERDGGAGPVAGRVHVRALLTWGALAALLVVWEIRELVRSPRVAYPTVTSLVTGVFSFRPAQALAFLAWLALGFLLIEPGRRR